MCLGEVKKSAGQYALHFFGIFRIVFEIISIYKGSNLSII